MCYNECRERGAGKMRSCPVDVIAVCSADGQIRPLRFRLEDGSRGIFRVNVDEIVSVKDIQHVGVEAQVFVCKSVFCGKEFTFELKYMIRSHSWRLNQGV